MTDMKMFSRSAWFLLSLFLLTLTVSCSKKEEVIEDYGGYIEDTMQTYVFRQDSTFVEADSVKTPVKYSLIDIKTKEGKARLDSLSDEERYVVLALNRLDEKNHKLADKLIIPDSISLNMMKYTPFPKFVDTLKAVNKIAIFSYPIQAFALYENGELVKWGPTSMGKKATPTDTGLFFTNWKAEETKSSFDDEWILRYNFNVENKLGIGWHQYDMPGYPASHACMRLLEKDAVQMYGWAEQWVLTKNEQDTKAKGTPVIVYGSYDFEGPKPWLSLVEDGLANDVTEEELSTELAPFIEEILKEQKIREDYFKNRKTTPPKS